MVPTKVYDYDPRNLPKELLEAIGLAIANASQTEAILGMAIGGVLGVDSEYTLAATTHMALPLKFSVLRSAAEIRIDDLDDLDKLDELLDAVDLALGKRHEIAHQGWCIDPETGRLYRSQFKARTRLDGELSPVSIQTVRNDAAAIYQAGMDLMKFIGTRNLLPPHAPAPRPRDHKSRAARKKRRKG